MPSIGVMNNSSEFLTPNLDYLELAPENDAFGGDTNPSLLNGILFIDDEADDVTGYGDNIGINLNKPNEELSKKNAGLEPKKSSGNDAKSNSLLKNRSSFYDNHYWYDEEQHSATAAAESDQKAKTFISEKSIHIEQVVPNHGAGGENGQAKSNAESSEAPGKPDRDDFDDLIDLTQRVPKKLLKADYIAFSNAPRCKAYSNGAAPVTVSEKNLASLKNDFKAAGSLRAKYNPVDKNASLPPLPPLTSHSFRHERATKMESGTAGSTTSLSAVHSTTRLIIPVKREVNNALNSTSLTSLNSVNNVSASVASHNAAVVANNNSNNNSLLSTSAHSLPQQSQQSPQAFNSNGNSNSNSSSFVTRHRTMGDVLRENNYTAEQNHFQQSHQRQQQHHNNQPLVRSNGYDGLSSASTVSSSLSSSSSTYYDDKCSPAALHHHHGANLNGEMTESENRYSHQQSNGSPSGKQQQQHPNGGSSYLSSFVNKYSGPAGSYGGTAGKSPKNNIYQLHNDVIYEEESHKPAAMNGHLKSNEASARPKQIAQDVSQEWDQITKIFASLETLLNEVVESTTSKPLQTPLQTNSAHNSKSALNTVHLAPKTTSNSENHSPASSSFLSPGSSISNSSTNPSVKNEPVMTSHLYKPFSPTQLDLTRNGTFKSSANSRDTYDEPIVQPRVSKPSGHTQQSSVKLWVKNSGQHPSALGNTTGGELKKLNPKNSKHVEVCEFLKNLNLAKYEFVFITNGYDDINFLNHVITLQDLLHMGIEDYEDTFKILKEIKNLTSSIKRIVDENVQFSSVAEWLDYLNLSEYKETFTMNHIDSLKRVRQLWEIELTTILQIPYQGHRQRIISSIEAKSRVDEEPPRRDEEEASKNSEKNVQFQSTQTDDYLENKSNGSTNSSASSSNATKKSSTSSSGGVKSVKFAEDSCLGPVASSKISSVTHLINTAAATLGLVNNNSPSNDTHSNSSCNSNKNQSDFQSSSSLEENSSLELEPNEGLVSMPEPKTVPEYALKPLFSNDQYKLLQTAAAHHGHEPKKPMSKPQQHQLSREDLSHKKKLELAKSVDDKRLNVGKKPNGQQKVESRPLLETNGTANESQRSPKPVWKNDPQHLIKNTCNFSVQYLGSSALTKLKSNVDPVKFTIDRLKNTAKASPHPSPLVELAVSINGVKLLHSKTKDLLWNHDIKHINNVCQDQDDLNYFAFSTQTDPSAHYYCHVFACKEKELTTKIILTIGQAFDLAYELFCKNNL